MRIIGLLFILLLFSAQVVEAFHHHDDGVVHHDCSVCCSACLHSDDVLGVPPLAAQRKEFSFAIVLLPVPTLSSETFPNLINSRAPPA